MARMSAFADEVTESFRAQVEYLAKEHDVSINTAFFGYFRDGSSEYLTADFLMDQAEVPLKAIIGRLKQTYCHSIGVEYMHLQDPDERRWLQERMEPTGNRADLSAADRVETQIPDIVCSEGGDVRRNIEETISGIHSANG